jgi:glycine cleavage system H protein
MTDPRPQTRYYKRSRFVTHLPTDRVYTSSHYWLLRDGAGQWTVGLTRFATRMLGDIVELGFHVAAADAITIGQGIGFLEGFKAVSDIYSVVDGTFAAANADLDRDITLLESDPYGRGWLFRAAGTAEPRHHDAEGYAAILDTTIDAMLASRHDLTGGDEES